MTAEVSPICRKQITKNKHEAVGVEYLYELEDIRREASSISVGCRRNVWRGYNQLESRICLEFDLCF